MKELTFTRRQGLGFAGIAVLGFALAACSTGTVESGESRSSAATSDKFPVKIKHVHGTTTVEKAATRPAVVGWSSGDIMVGLGVLPVVVPSLDWGENANQSTDWFDEAAKKLGAVKGNDKYPTQFSDTEGIDFTAIAKSAPDVIIALQSGITKDDYDKLSKIAPTIAYLDAPWGTDWKKMVTVIGQVLGKSQQAAKQVADTAKLLTGVGDKYPQIKGKSVISASLSAEKGAQVWLYAPSDARCQMLSSIGMKLAQAAYPAGAEYQRYLQPYSAEKAAELKSDVIVNWLSTDTEDEAVVKDPLISQIPAVAKGAIVSGPSKQVNWAITLMNPLSLSWGLESFVPGLVKAADRADKK